MYHGLAGSSSDALFQTPTYFPTAGVIASYEQGAGGKRNNAPGYIKSVFKSSLISQIL